MLPSPCYVISDAHLGVADPDAERLLLAFLRDIRRDAKTLVINGDLFDFWFEWKRVIPRAGYRVLAALADLADDGVEIVWVAGNHDCWGGEVLRQDVGVDYLRGPVARRHRGLGVAHRARGRPADEEDRRYRVLRVVLRHRPRDLGLSLAASRPPARLALGSSHASRTYRAKDGGAACSRWRCAPSSRSRRCSCSSSGIRTCRWSSARSRAPCLPIRAPGWATRRSFASPTTPWSCGGSGSRYPDRRRTCCRTRAGAR
ncbi:MAG: metallophosphoesterase [Gemmatimonadetes bacterium]|nr:metallophosphoesterase [Gemmatimonadota bacterium]